MKEFNRREAELFQKCLELPIEERENFLRDSCNGNDELYKSVLSLLDVCRTSNGFLDTSSDEVSETASIIAELRDNAPGAEKPGDVIGRYRLLELLGEGAWGSVWVAQQIEGFTRQVALKILKRDRRTSEFQTKFESERQTLAMLNHPFIVHALDAGSTKDGLPFLAMEWVKGKSLIEYADLNRLDIPERIDLFIKICQAIHHAHQQGIVHRDIKPSNILVTNRDGEPIPKIVDFGVAKRNAYSHTEISPFTSIHTFIGTAVYSSPEQLEFKGNEIDFRTDIYSLGIVLYELISGRVPFDIENSSNQGIDAFRELVRQSIPPRPSDRFRCLLIDEKSAIAKNRRSSVPKFASSITGDLDSIVLKCLEYEPKRRYESAIQVANDLKKYNAGKNVSVATPNRVNRIKNSISKSRTPYAFFLEFSVVGLIILAAFLLIVPNEFGSDLETSSPISENQNSQTSIAVLPFENMSLFSESDSYVDEFHEDIITSLSQVDDFLVIGRTSTLRYRDTTDPLQQIGDELGVQYLLTGSVRQDRSWTLVNAQLVDTQTEALIWAEKYYSDIDDELTIQNSITFEIAAQLQEDLSTEEIINIEYRPTRNPDAYELYKRAMLLVSESRYEGEEKISLLERAVELDPEFGLAWAQLSIERVYWWGTEKRGKDPELLAQAYEALDRARQTVPNRAAIHFAESSFSYWVDNDLGLSLDNVLTALSVDPDFRRAKQILGVRYLDQGRLSEAQHHFGLVLAEDPFYQTANNWMVSTYQMRGLWDDASALIESNQERSTNKLFWQIRAIQNSYFETGDRDLFIKELSRIDEFSGSEGGRTWIALMSRNLNSALAFLSGDIIELQEPELIILPTLRFKRYNLDFEPVSLLSALLWFELGNRDSYIAESRKSKEYWESMVEDNSHVPPNALSSLAICYALEGDRAKMDSTILKARNLTKTRFWRFKQKAKCEMQIAIAYLVAGNQDLAIETLEAASNLNSPMFFQRELDSWFIFDRLRGKSRFEAMLNH